MKHQEGQIGGMNDKSEKKKKEKRKNGKWENY